MLDYSIPIPKEYWNKPEESGVVLNDAVNGKKICVYIPYGYNPENCYDVFYFKMGTNNKATQFFTWPGIFSNFNYVIDNLIKRGEIRPSIIVSIDGEGPNRSWLPDNAYTLVCYVEGKYTSYAKRNADLIIESAPHRAIGGWSLGSIECRTMLVNDNGNNYWNMFGWYDIQSGYNANKMNTISPIPFVACVAGSRDDRSCINFTNTCKKYFLETPGLEKNVAQVVPGYTHMIKYQLNYFYNAIKHFFAK